MPGWNQLKVNERNSRFTILNIGLLLKTDIVKNTPHLLIQFDEKENKDMLGSSFRCEQMPEL
jgi:hypothetical protein